MARLALPLLLATTALAGCMSVPYPGGPTGPSGASTGGVAFYVKDAPADGLKSVFVTIDWVEVHRAEGSENETNDSHESSSHSDSDRETLTSSATPASSSAPSTSAASNATRASSTATTAASNRTTASSSPSSSAASSSSASASSTVSASSSARASSGEFPKDERVTPEIESGDHHEGSGGWVTVVNTTHTIDLKNFSGDARALLGNATLPSGRYTQIRLHVVDAWGITLDGQRVDLKIPGGVLRIVRPWTVENGQVTAVTVDFDLAHSIVLKGNGQYAFKPVLKLSADRAGPLDDGKDREREKGDGGRDGEHGRGSRSANETAEDRGASDHGRDGSKSRDD